MSTTPESTIERHSTLPSPSGTAVDLNEQTSAQPKQQDAIGTEAGALTAETATDAETGRNTVVEEERVGAEHKLSQGRKYFLLLIFSVAQYLDVCSYSGIFLYTNRIADDLGIKYLSSTWVITAYSVTFASFLLLWGRVADLWSARPVFAYGFLGLGITNLIISFMPNQYAYFVFRAVSGIFASATIPSAFRLIPAVFEPHELNMALMLFGLSGAIANITGLLFAGFFGFIHAHNQNSDWRWFYRMITIVIVPFALGAFTLIPHTSGARANEVHSQREKIKRLDLAGALSMLIAIILLILGLTLGATYGFKTAKFLVPFLLSWPIFVFFFIWEWRLPEGYALIPSSFWFIPNMTLLMFIAIGIYSVWGFVLIGLLQTWQVVHNESPIIAAVRFLPGGISAFVVAFVVPGVLGKVSPRWPIAVGMILGGVGYILFIFSRGNLGHDYWRYIFPGLIIGSGMTMAAFLGTNITVMTSVPPETSGVAGAMLQVCLQVGAVLGLSIQAGLLTIKPGNITNEYNVQASFWFEFGWCILNAILVTVLFRNKAAPGSEAAQQMEKGEKKGEVQA